MNFCDYLKQKRIENRLSQRDLSKLSGVSYSYLSQLETGARNVPKPQILKQLAPHLNVSYEELFKEVGYLTDDSNMSNFPTNLILIRGKMSTEEFAAAIRKKSGIPMFTAKMLDSLENGSIDPTEETIETLSSFACVRKGFWYEKNDSEALALERQFCEANKDSGSCESIDGLGFHTVRFPLSYPNELVEWLQNTDVLEYLKLAKTLYDKDINALVVESLLFKNNREGK